MIMLFFLLKIQEALINLNSHLLLHVIAGQIREVLKCGFPFDGLTWWKLLLNSRGLT